VTCSYQEYVTGSNRASCNVTDNNVTANLFPRPRSAQVQSTLMQPPFPDGIRNATCRGPTMREVTRRLHCRVRPEPISVTTNTHDPEDSRHGDKQNRTQTITLE
jgi:hypothetical protein